MSGSGTSAMPPTEQPSRGDETRRLFGDAFKHKDGVVTIDLNQLGDDTETAIEVGKVLGGKALDAVGSRARSFMASLQQHVDNATAEVKAKRAAKPADPVDVGQPPA